MRIKENSGTKTERQNEAGLRLCLELFEGMWDENTIREGSGEGRSGDEGMRGSHTHLHERPHQSTGVAHLGLWVSPLGID